MGRIVLAPAAVVQALVLALVARASAYTCVESVDGYCVVANVTPPYDDATFPAGETAVWIRNSTIPSFDRALLAPLGAVENLMIHRLQIERLALHGCDSLEVLFAPHNAIDTLEAGDEGLPLRQLHLYQNRLTDVDALRVLTALEQLYLHENLLETLRADVFAPLQRLKILTLQRNRLRTIATTGAAPLALPHLEQLFLQFNALPHLDTTRWRMGRLRVLDLSHNRLAFLLTFLEELPALRTVALHHNPWHCAWLSGMLERLGAREMDSRLTAGDVDEGGGGSSSSSCPAGQLLLGEQLCCSENATAPDPVLLLVTRTAIVDELQRQVSGAGQQIAALEEAQRKHGHQLRELSRTVERLEQQQCASAPNESVAEV